MDRTPKRQRLSEDVEESKTGNRPPGPQSLSRAISPPKKRNRHGDRIASPFQLTRIRDLPEAANKDTVTLKDILGDPLIAECWEFNFLHDIHFLMSHFDEDTRNLVKVHVVHGFWKKEDPNRLALQKDAEAYPNVELHGAFMPEMFGTHHSKMMVLIRHDDSAQVIIHTANMIVRDWTNMTNAVWRSPLLPLLSDDDAEDTSPTDHPFGTGKRFKHDLLSYLRAYNARRPITRTLVAQLCNYDFSSTAWGWPALKRALGSVPVQEGKSEIVVQVSSIATLGPTDILSETAAIQKAGRERAAPHIKTYIRYGEKSIDWALVTSANISKQAWGEATGASQEVRVASWEVGVLVWPSIITDNATMVGTFESDMPPREGGSGDTVIGLRIPYNLPLQSYGKDEIPWVASMAHTEPDRMGGFWGAE
ncbi:tyrosyl-DNA phosphodiesterase [Colletotrichum tabaci]|uniref:Tyrosyl-DNA phosphodiesterase n=1 Tax=Colletotrichum tabaci TaxID=1209068 RepID=A0AAV9TRH0_9PEZI